MKDILRMLGYSAGAVVVIALLIEVTSSHIPPGMEVAAGLLLVIVLPLALVITLVNRKKGEG